MAASGRKRPSRYPATSVRGPPETGRVYLFILLWQHEASVGDRPEWKREVDDSAATRPVARLAGCASRPTELAARLGTAYDFRAAIMEVLSSDGNYFRSGAKEERLARCDTIVYMD